MIHGVRKSIPTEKAANAVNNHSNGNPVSYWKAGSYIRNCKFIECRTGVADTDLLLEDSTWIDCWMPTIGVKYMKGGTAGGHTWGFYDTAKYAVYEDMEIKDGTPASRNYAFDQFYHPDYAFQATFRRMHVHHNFNAFIIAGAKENVIEDCLVHDNTGGSLYAQNETSQGNIFRRNEVYNSDAGMTAAHAVRNFWVDNYIHDCTVGGVSSGRENTFSRNRIERCKIGINLQGEVDENFIGRHVIEGNIFSEISEAEIDLFTSRFNIIRNQNQPFRLKSNSNIEVSFEWTNLRPYRSYVLKIGDAEYSFITNGQGAARVDIVHTGLHLCELRLKTNLEFTDIIVFPNPFIGNKSAGNTINFVNLPKRALISVYSVAGKRIARFEHNSATDNGNETWDVSNAAGGIYLYTITLDGMKKTGKISVVK